MLIILFKKGKMVIFCKPLNFLYFTSILNPDRIIKKLWKYATWPINALQLSHRNLVLTFHNANGANSMDTKNYCTLSPKCVKCRSSHLTAECTKVPTAAPKCANCSGEHSASWRGCSVYKKILKPSKP